MESGRLRCHRLELRVGMELRIGSYVRVVVRCLPAVTQTAYEKPETDYYYRHTGDQSKPRIQPLRSNEVRGEQHYKP